MRLNCPNCDAQYEVPVDVIPAEGRDVQCSSCGITWFQAHPDHAAEPDLDLDIPAPAEEWSAEPASTPEPETAEAVEDAEPEEDVETPEPAMSESLEETLKQAVREKMPEEVSQVIAEEVEAKIEESPLGDFEAALDAQLASGDDLSWHAAPEPEAEPEPEDIFAAEPEPTPAPETAFEEPAAPEQEHRFEEPAEPAEDDSGLFAAEAAAGRGRARRRREVDPSVADILREEASFEAEARRAEETAIETQQEFGLDTPEEDEVAKRAGQARARMARMRGISDEPQVSSEPEQDPNGSRRNLLPDIEEINSTLRATEDRTPEELPDGRPTATQRRRGGSRLGFGFGLILIAALMFVYARPGTVTTQFPTAAPTVGNYVSAVDDSRIWLDVQMTKLMLWLDGMASDQPEGEA